MILFTNLAQKIIRMTDIFCIPMEIYQYFMLFLLCFNLLGCLFSSEHLSFIPSLIISGVIVDLSQEPSGFVGYV